MTLPTHHAWVLLWLCFGAMSAWSQGPDNSDPLHSSRWPDTRRFFFAQAPLRFDAAVVVTAPAHAEDSMNVPVSVRVNAPWPVQRLLVFAEMNPIVPVLDMEPMGLAPYIAFRMKLQQSSPIRAAALDHHGVWHVGSAWVDAVGGGCTAPGTGRAEPDWQKHLNTVHSRVWSSESGPDRLRLRIHHPMDTGLAASIPEFYIQNLSIQDEQGHTYLKLTLHQPISQNPIFSFDIPPALRSQHRLRLRGMDNNGNPIDQELP